MNIQIVDNFLFPEDFQKIYDCMMGDGFPWFYKNGLISFNNPKNTFHFTYVFSLGIPDIFSPCLNKLNISEKNLIRIKANLTPKTIFHRSSGFHIDYQNVTTSIFYINTCNGYTKFKNGFKVESLANRMVTFDSNIEHSGVTCTNKTRRVVLNLNYGT